MDGRLDLVLDGGTAIGGASTTVDITGVNWRVIREGTLTERDLADCLDGV
jgi:tRNA A37 threonylcarbamoyladenosine synthetase subunit TsaC/SUA5/YrdC